MENTLDLLEVLQHIDPERLDYQEWLSIGMALKDAGHTAQDWDGWSQSDSKRYHQGECERKWTGFLGSSTPVTAGTIVQLAKDQGWRGSFNPEDGHELEWDAAIGGKDELIVLDKGWLEDKEVNEPAEWDPVRELTTYLELLFEASENVGYVTESYKKDERFVPANKGAWDRTAGQLIHLLNQCGGDIGRVIGDYNSEAGAWIRFNPLDGKGIKNENVTEYRYALVESDNMALEKQNAIIRELELPVACLVHSGKKSLHAIVRVEASSYDEYRKRVDYLYNVLKKNGMSVDTQNKNPSRLSRMPGAMRNGHKQYILDKNIGKESWKEWQEWIESINDDLPDAESLTDVWDNLPELSPSLINGLLRQGHKMLLAGPSKAGKSFALIELCCAIAEGREWMGFKCSKGRILYVNLELDRASCLHRFKDVYTALGWQPNNLANIDIWNLRGKSVPMDKLAPKLIRRAMKKNYIAIVIDPIYKIITGDENSADQMAQFCNQFDKVCTELGCAVIYCHHHSKGGQGGKKSMDRASGSGVFARDPDALLDLIELELTDSIKAHERSKAAANAYLEMLKKAIPKWQDEVSQDDMCSEKAMHDACMRLLSKPTLIAAEDTANAAKDNADIHTGWRIEGTLREFPKFEPINVWFDYPIHRIDRVGALGDIDAEGERLTFKRGLTRNKTPDVRERERKDELETAYEACSLNGDVTIKDLVEYTGKTTNTIRKYIDDSDTFSRDGGKVFKGSTGSNNDN
ncbi:MAG: DNA primase [Firmicutes bacterium HGW-Firmicutes-16]|nr:MAG: DNA primase [Firmicutes bacterium HGW-Firmicutes-16]